jgi:4'-phosphopantetheinyl transferase
MPGAGRLSVFRWRGAPTAGEVHLWRAELDVAPALLDLLGTCLNREEMERSARFRRELDRTRFVAARGWLRTLLARYLNTAPSEIRLAVGLDGKPRLAGGPGRLRFNLAHSDRVAVCAVAWDREVGVDVERLRPDFPIDEVARSFFSIQERADLAALPRSDRMRAAFDCWTRKEAYLKAVGTGLLRPLDEFDVTVLPGEPLHVHDRRAPDGMRWSLHGFDAGPGYSAAVVVEGGGCRVPGVARPVALALAEPDQAAARRSPIVSRMRAPRTLSSAISDGPASLSKAPNSPKETIPAIT